MWGRFSPEQVERGLDRFRALPVVPQPFDGEEYLQLASAPDRRAVEWGNTPPVLVQSDFAARVLRVLNSAGYSLLGSSQLNMPPRDWQAALDRTGLDFSPFEQVAAPFRRVKDRPDLALVVFEPDLPGRLKMSSGFVTRLSGASSSRGATQFFDGRNYRQVPQLPPSTLWRPSARFTQRLGL